MSSEELKIPTCYAEWLEWFDLLQTKKVDLEKLQQLRKGCCTDSGATIEYFENQLIKTENILLKNFLREFGKTLEMYLSYCEYDRIYEPFRLLAKQFSACLFFEELRFMSIEFRMSLRDSVIANARDHWKKAIKSIYTSCMESGSVILEDQLYMIKKIRLFGDSEKKSYE